MKPAQRQKIEANVKARLVADEVIELADDAAVGMNGSAAIFWMRINAAVSERLGLSDEPATIYDEVEPFSDEDARRFGAEVMKFGKHRGKRVDDVPLDYLDWLCQDSQDFRRKLLRYLKSRRIQAEQRPKDERYIALED